MYKTIFNKLISRIILNSKVNLAFVHLILSLFSLISMVYSILPGYTLRPMIRNDIIISSN